MHSYGMGRRNGSRIWVPHDTSVPYFLCWCVHVEWSWLPRRQDDGVEVALRWLLTSPLTQCGVIAHDLP